MLDPQPAYALHALPYKETSLVVELWTPKGRVPVVAKGAKRPHSSLRSALMGFQPLLVRWTGRGEVKNLTHCEWAGGHLPPDGDALFAAYYLNELLLKFIPREDPHPVLFARYARSIAQLATGFASGPVVRQFELILLREMGLSPGWTHDLSGACLQPDVQYQWVKDKGWMSLVTAEMDRTSSAPVLLGEVLLKVGPSLEPDGTLTDEMANPLRALTRWLLAHASGSGTVITRRWMEYLKNS